MFISKPNGHNFCHHIFQYKRFISKQE